MSRIVLALAVICVSLAALDHFMPRTSMQSLDCEERATLELVFESTPMVAATRRRAAAHCDLKYMETYMRNRTSNLTADWDGMAVVIPDEHGGWGNMVLFNHMWRLSVAFLWDSVKLKHNRSSKFVFATQTAGVQTMPWTQWADYWATPPGVHLVHLGPNRTVMDMHWRWKGMPDARGDISRVVTEPRKGMFVPITPKSDSRLQGRIAQLGLKHKSLARVTTGHTPDIPGCLSYFMVQKPRKALMELVVGLFSRLPPSIRVIGIHDRAGDACMWTEAQGPGLREVHELDKSVQKWIKTDKRGDGKCTGHLKTFEEADRYAQHAVDEGAQEPVFFVAADTQRVVDAAKKRWPGRVIHTPGRPVQNQHYKFDSVSRTEAAVFNFKTVADWYILTLCHAVVGRVKSTFTATAGATGFNRV